MPKRAKIPNPKFRHIKTSCIKTSLYINYIVKFCVGNFTVLLLFFQR